MSSSLRHPCYLQQQEEEGVAPEEQQHRSTLQRSPPIRRTGTGGTSVLSSVDSQDDPDVALVEMVLEPYFMHIDNTYNKLKSLMEYVGDTEVGTGCRGLCRAAADARAERAQGGRAPSRY